MNRRNFFHLAFLFLTSCRVSSVGSSFETPSKAPGNSVQSPFSSDFSLDFGTLNQRGASILEVVIMSGVMVAMLTGFMSLMSHEAKSVTYLEDKLSRVALESELRMQFAGSDYCKNLLGGLAAPRKSRTKDITKSLNQTLQVAALNKVFQKRGNKTFYDKLEIKKVSMENSSLTAANSSGTVDLMFYPERMRVGGGPSNLQPIKIKTEVSVDGAYKITSCASSGEEDGKSCVISDGIKGFPSTVRTYSCQDRIGHDGIQYPSGLRSSDLTLTDHKVYVDGKPRSFSDYTYSMKIPSSRLIQTNASWAYRDTEYMWSMTWQCADGKLYPIGVGVRKSDSYILSAVLKGKNFVELDKPACN